MAFSPFTLKNNAKGVVITDSSSSITFDSSGYTLPINVTDGPFLITLEQEIAKVTNVVDHTSYYTLTTTRAQEGTTYASHASDITGGLLITAGLIDNIQDYVSLIDTTSNIDLNSMESAVALNTAKVTNQNHTGDVTGSTALAIVPAAISGKTTATPASGDYVLLLDATDSALKKADVSAFLSAGGAGDVTGPSSSILNSVSIFDSTTGKSIASTNITIDGTGNDLNIPGTLEAVKQIRNTVQQSLGTTGAVTWNVDTYPSAKIIPTGNITLTLSGVALNSNSSLYFVQDASTAYTITWDSNIIWAGGYGPDLSTLSSKHFINFFSYDGTGIWGSHISSENAYSGLLNVKDTSSDHYFFGADATGNQHAWSTGQSLIQLGEDASIVNNKSLSNTGMNLMLGSYIDTSGLYKYTSTDNAQRINLNASSNQIDFYHCDSSSHVEGDGVNFKKRVSIAPTGLYVYNNSNTQVFGVDVTGNIAVSGLVDGRDIATDGTKLDGIASGAQVNTVASVNGQTGTVVLVSDDIADTTSTHKFITSAEKTKLSGIEASAQINTVTPTNTISFENKRNLPRTSVLTSGTTVNWQSADYDINFLGVGHNLTIAADSSGASAQTGEIREFVITANGTNTVTFDTTSSYGFHYSSDVTGYTVSDTSGKIDLVLAQYLLNNKWNIIGVNKGF